MTPERYGRLYARLFEMGYGPELDWAASGDRCASADDFAFEHAYVVCNSGMKAQIARAIFDRVKAALIADDLAGLVFGHQAKAAAIDQVWHDRAELYQQWQRLSSQVTLELQLLWLQQLPFIGEITVYHLAKNLGVDCCKPDRHLVRIAALSGETPAALCARLSKESGDRVRVVDSVLWRAANLGLV